MRFAALFPLVFAVASVPTLGGCHRSDPPAAPVAVSTPSAPAPAQPAQPTTPSPTAVAAPSSTEPDRASSPNAAHERACRALVTTMDRLARGTNLVTLRSRPAHESAREELKALESAIATIRKVSTSDAELGQVADAYREALARHAVVVREVSRFARTSGHTGAKAKIQRDAARVALEDRRQAVKRDEASARRAILDRCGAANADPTDRD